MVVFLRKLAELTPRVYMTRAIVGANVLVYVLMVASGVSATNPTVPDLLAWGANYGPKTVGGEWWRLLTAMFVHLGIVHLVFNMLVLAAMGPWVERMVGNWGFLVLYMLAGLGGGVLSLFWDARVVTVGASGAIFGVYGAALGLLLKQSGSIPAEVHARLRKRTLRIIIINLVFGLMMPLIDVAAHVGGLVVGLFIGILLNQPFTPESLARRPGRNLVSAGLGCVLVVGMSFVVHDWCAGLADAQSVLERCEALEARAIERYNAAQAKHQKQELTDEAFARVLEREVLPDWRTMHDQLKTIHNIPLSLQDEITAFIRYVQLRQQSTELLAQGLREGDGVKAQKAGELQVRAEGMFRGKQDSDR
jgi:rhomboid protease GluP